VAVQRVAGGARPFRNPKLTSGPHFASYLETYCRHTKGELAGHAVTFEAWQREIWNDALEIDAKTGRRRVRYLLSGRPRKNYKSAECAGAALYLASADGEIEPEVYLGSGAKEQAGIVFKQALGFIQANPDLSRLFQGRRTYIRCPSTRGEITRVSAEGRLQHGLNPHGVVLDELHAFTTDAQIELFTALTTADALRQAAFIAAITTAGFDLETLLGEEYQAAMKFPDVVRFGKHGCLTVARDPETRSLMVWYGAPEGADVESPEVWRECNPAETLPLEFLKRQFAVARRGGKKNMNINDFCRLHLNMWTAAKDRWITDEEWARGASAEKLPKAVDWAYALPDGRVVHRKRVWSAREEIEHDVFCPGGRVDLEDVELFITDDLAKRFKIRELVYDPRFFQETAQRIAKRGIRAAELYQGSSVMADALQTFYSDVKSGLVLHDPDDTVFDSHIRATAGQMTERGWKISKLKSSKPIDATVASVMAHSRAARKKKRAYEGRGLLVIGDNIDDGDDE
jgi:phage terminase large subunit-like protein